MCRVTFPTFCTSSVRNFLVICHPRTCPIPSLPLYTSKALHALKTEFPWFSEKSMGPSMWETPNPNPLRRTLMLPLSFPGATSTSVWPQGPPPKSSAHPCSPKSTPRFSGWFQAGSPGNLRAPGTRPAFKLLSSGSFHPERTQFPSPGETGRLLKLFCQHPDRAGLGFNDIAVRLLHSYKDCFDTSRIFDLLVKVKY